MKVNSLTLVKLVDLIFAPKSSQMKFKKRVRSDLNIILIQYYTTKQLTVQEFINDKFEVPQVTRVMESTFMLKYFMRKHFMLEHSMSVL